MAITDKGVKEKLIDSFTPVNRNYLTEIPVRGLDQFGKVPSGACLKRSSPMRELANRIL
jgi:hypothetical protein